MAEALAEEGHEGRQASRATRSSPPIPAPSSRTCWPTTPSCPRPPVWCWRDYVTMDSGTGCVHTAPGFGADDYQTCKRYGMDMVVPVDDQGRHTDYAGKYAGMKTEESNPIILADMKESGAAVRLRGDRPLLSPLLALQGPHHLPGHARSGSAPWRPSRTRPCAACDDVRWVPAWGMDRMKSMIRERADWCISRQRTLGPAHPRVLLQRLRQAHRAPTRPSPPSPTCLATEGSNAWFAKDAAEHPARGLHLPPLRQVQGFTKEEDTLDGWFDSGSTHFASMKRDQGFWPADMYLEGLDQYRGWFQSALLTAVGATGPGRTLQGVHHPRLDRGRRGQGHAQVPGQRRGPR